MSKFFAAMAIFAFSVSAFAVSPQCTLTLENNYDGKDATTQVIAWEELPDGGKAALVQTNGFNVVVTYLNGLYNAWITTP